MHHPIYIVDRQGRYRRVDYLQPQESRLAEPLDMLEDVADLPMNRTPGPVGSYRVILGLVGSGTSLSRGHRQAAVEGTHMTEVLS